MSANTTGNLVAVFKKKSVLSGFPSYIGGKSVVCVQAKCRQAVVKTVRSGERRRFTSFRCLH